MVAMPAYIHPKFPKAGFALGNVNKDCTTACLLKMDLLCFFQGKKSVGLEAIVGRGRLSVRRPKIEDSEPLQNSKMNSVGK
jgi:hypothetical protein